jgi:hypothetical protein
MRMGDEKGQIYELDESRVEKRSVYEMVMYNGIALPANGSFLNHRIATDTNAESIAGLV